MLKSCLLLLTLTVISVSTFPQKIENITITQEDVITSIFYDLSAGHYYDNYRVDVFIDDFHKAIQINKASNGAIGINITPGKEKEITYQEVLDFQLTPKNIIFKLKEKNLVFLLGYNQYLNTKEKWGISSYGVNLFGIKGGAIYKFGGVYASFINEYGFLSNKKIALPFSFGLIGVLPRGYLFYSGYGKGFIGYTMVYLEPFEYEGRQYEGEYDFYLKNKIKDNMIDIGIIKAFKSVYLDIGGKFIINKHPVIDLFKFYPTIGLGMRL
jgi:hypothetical protein